MSWYLAVLKKYAVFAGRARRTEYWMFALVNFIISVVLQIIARASGSNVLTIISLVYALALLLPGLAVLVRRLHDIGKSGAWFWIVLIPLVGPIWLLVLMATAGERNANRYGPDPKAASA